MKRVITFLMAGLIVVNAWTFTSYASSLDDVVNGSETTTVVSEQPETNYDSNYSSSSSVNYNDSYLDELGDATRLSEPSAGATRINQGIKRVASFIVQVLSYFLTAFLVVKVILDVCYITLPFTRNFLSNGYVGNAAAAQDPSAMQGGMQNGMGMGGMNGGFGGMGGGFGGMSGGFGGGMGMNRGFGGGMGMGMGMGGMQGGMGQQQPAGNPFKTQLVSDGALNAVAAQKQTGVNPFKHYAKSELPLLIIAPIFLVLAITGTLTNIGFMLGDMLARALSGIGNMI